MSEIIDKRTAESADIFAAPDHTQCAVLKSYTRKTYRDTFPPLATDDPLSYKSKVIFAVTKLNIGAPIVCKSNSPILINVTVDTLHFVIFDSDNFLR